MSSPTRHRQGGPPLPLPAAIATALTAAAAAVFAGGPTPSTTPAAALHYLRLHGTQQHALAFLIASTSIPLATWTAATYRRLRTLGVTAPGAVIALVGGTLASASLALSGLVTWVTAENAPSVDAGTARVLVDLAFVTGAAGFTLPFGLLLAGVAVPGLLLGLLPRPLAWAGLVLAAVGALSSLTLLTSTLDATLPITRFGGLLWAIAAGVALPATRHRKAGRGPEGAPGIGATVVPS
jgi:hypothetical protein